MGNHGGETGGEQAILRAAADELTASGYAGMTMAKVAQRAGTNKNAIYRRRPQRAALGIAAYRSPMMLLRGEYALRGAPAVPDEVLAEIVDETRRLRRPGACGGGAGPSRTGRTRQRPRRG